MKKSILLLAISGVAILFLIGYFTCRGEYQITNAQVLDDDAQKLRERDAKVSQEQLDRTETEAKKIQDDILNSVDAKMPKFGMKRKSLKFVTGLGDRGIISSQISWQNGETRMNVEMYLRLAKEGMKEEFWRGLNFISMGDFFTISDIGDEAILVKNVSANTKMTNVGLHFIKGRAMVSVYLTNYKRKTEKNEKELMEIVRLIEPLIVARDNFDD